MLTLETLTEADVQRLLPRSVKKGYGYISRVKNPVRVEQMLSAHVQGNWPYEVEASLEPSGLTSRCTCSWGGGCKHIAALLLKWVKSPREFSAGQAPVLLEGYPLEVIKLEPPATYRPQELPEWLRVSFDERRRAEMGRLRGWLQHISLPALRAMAAARGWQIKGNNKQAAIEQIAAQMSSPAEIARGAASLDAEHRRVLAALLLLGCAQPYDPQVLEQVARLGGELTAYKHISTYTQHLVETGLAIYGSALNWYPPVNVVPDVLGRHLVPVQIASGATADQADSSGAPASPPELADPYQFVRAVNQVALLLEQKPVALRPPMPRPRIEKFFLALQEWDYDPAEIAAAERDNKLRPYDYSEKVFTVPPPAHPLLDEAIERLAAVAGGAERLEFVYFLLTAIGFFQPGSPLTVWPEVKEQFLRRDELSQHAILARAFFNLTTWSEVWALARAGYVQVRRRVEYGHYKLSQMRADLARLRNVALRVLACLPEDRWIHVDDLFALMRPILPRLDPVTARAYWSDSETAPWFLARPGSQKPLDPAADWLLAQGNFIRQIIAGPLHWLGLADLKMAEAPSGLAAFRLHGLADLYLDRAAAVAAPRRAEAAPPGAAQAAVALDEYKITVNPSAISAQAHGLLDRIARLETASAGRFVYQLDAHAVYRSFEAGIALSDISADWERFLSVPMPETIRSQLAQWWDSYGRVRIYQDVTVLELGDDYALAELEAVSSLKQAMLAQISPRLIIINQGAIPALMAELEKAGYTPKQTNQV